MATRNIVLTDHQSQVVDYLVASGRYQNASEVLRAGLRMVEEAESAYTTKVNELRAAVAEEDVKDVKNGKTRHFTADEFATYLSERAKEITGTKRNT
ncbi:MULTISPECIES: type II toxin-antitoxin system ParD family antitoxin [Marinobacter]|uniref:type II toxin-antitoxin system ParD family antitoxin n=2 Tax=Marinobacteraceae TaxID=2887365 RepID=UPI002942F023|nr:type II toxin-antitoxin system ParD family antitoxin [Marinobacter salarius]WOI20925.1 type II toxin-antitoxin system ParD family antitoxin [Marinobacter salarius]